jgi:hypothetical protein
MVQASLWNTTEAFIDCFNEHNGPQKMTELIKFGNWRLQGLILETFPRLYDHPSTVEYMRQNSQIFIILWECISEKNQQIKKLGLLNFV